MPVTLHVSIIRVIENGKLFKQTLKFCEPIVFSQYTFYFALDKKDLVRKDTCRVKMNSEVGKIETKKIGFCMHRNLFFNCPDCCCISHFS